jgi:hypothetical protein
VQIGCVAPHVVSEFSFPEFPVGDLHWYTILAAN